MSLIILTQYYPPEIGAPQRRLAELAERMVKAGHSVTVLTAMPNYPRGKIYEGYGGLVRRETLNGVRVIRTAIYPTQKASFVHRLTNYFSFVFSSALLGTFLLPRADYLLTESPPLFLGLSGIWLSFIKRARLIFNVSDLWPESAVHLGLVRKGSRIHKLSSWLERLCYRRAWLVTGQSTSILKDIQDRFPNQRIFLLSNGVDVNKFGPEYATEAARQQLNQDDKCTVLYAGLHGLAQGLQQILDVAELMVNDNIHFALVGDGPEKPMLIEAAHNKSLNNVTFLDPVPASEVPALLASADVLIITLKSYIPGAVPSKLYEAMATQKPIIMVASGEPSEIVERYTVGLTVSPSDIYALKEALTTLLNDPNLRERLGANGRSTAESIFNREKIVSAFIEYLEDNKI